MSGPDASIASLEFRFTLDRALAAHKAGNVDVADAFAQAAEAILRSSFPQVADDIAHAASRKGPGDLIGCRLVEHLDAASAACVAMVLTLRGARRRVVDVLSLAFRHEPVFNATIALLCERVVITANQRPGRMIQPTTIEVAALRRR